jgi:hypothetical protein
VTEEVGQATSKSSRSLVLPPHPCPRLLFRATHDRKYHQLTSHYLFFFFFLSSSLSPPPPFLSFASSFSSASSQSSPELSPSLSDASDPESADASSSDPNSDPDSDDAAPAEDAANSDPSDDSSLEPCSYDGYTASVKVGGRGKVGGRTSSFSARKPHPPSAKKS